MAKTNLGLPITKVTPVVGFIGQLISKLTTLDTNKDGKIAFLEIVNILQVVGFEAFQAFYGFSMAEFKDQLADIDEAERAQIIAVFKEKFSLTNTEAELLLEGWMEWLVQGVSLVQRTKRVFGKKEPQIVAA